MNIVYITWWKLPHPTPLHDDLKIGQVEGVWESRFFFLEIRAKGLMGVNLKWGDS